MRRAICVGVGAVALLALPTAAQGAATAKLRVLGPGFDLEQAWFVTGRTSVSTIPDADCGTGEPHGNGSTDLDHPTPLGLLKHAARWNDVLLPVLITDELRVCALGGYAADTDRFWYLKRNYQEPASGGTVKLRDGDRVVWYLAPSLGPNPAELIQHAPASAEAGAPFEVTTVAWSCPVPGQPCVESPAVGGQVQVNGETVATTDADGSATITVSDDATIRTIRNGDIPSKLWRICVGQGCPPPDGGGRTIFGRKRPDKIKGTDGWDTIRAGDGDDVLDIRQGGRDIVKCGAGRDLVIGRGRHDSLAANCERIRRAH